MSIEVTSKMVQELRERTGAGMMDCKRALVTCEGDLEAAADLMRKSGQAKADKKSGRVTAEGLITIAMAADQSAATMLETNCETDFVARDANFVTFANGAVNIALKSHAADCAALSIQSFDDTHSVEVTRTLLVAKLGENLNLRRLAHIPGPSRQQRPWMAASPEIHIHGWWLWIPGCSRSLSSGRAWRGPIGSARPRPSPPSRRMRARARRSRRARRRDAGGRRANLRQSGNRDTQAHSRARSGQHGERRGRHRAPAARLPVPPARA